MSVVLLAGIALTLLPWPTLYVLAGVWPEHPRYPMDYKRGRERVLTGLFIAPPIGLWLILVGLFA